MLIGSETPLEVAGTTRIRDSTLHAILRRMLLNDITTWKDNKTVFCSILGSRVQMGITTSFVVSSELVSQAYAHLVHFHPDNSGGTKKAVARIAFMPDPVCAALAMGMMNEHWVLTNTQGVDPIAGKEKNFWSEKAMELLSSGLCLPEKDSPGEIMVALYMLFCGDLLRYSQDKTLRHFSIPLQEWFGRLKNPKENTQPMSSSAQMTVTREDQIPQTSTKEESSQKRKRVPSQRIEVNFIQVCRNYFRANSWTTQKGLEWNIRVSKLSGDRYGCCRLRAGRQIGILSPVARECEMLRAILELAYNQRNG